MDAHLVRHRVSELSTVGTLFLGDDQFFTIERKEHQLPEGCHELHVHDGIMKIGDFPIMSGENNHGQHGTVGVGLQARRFRLEESALALRLIRSIVERSDDEEIIVEVIDQTDRQEQDHED